MNQVTIKNEFLSLKVLDFGAIIQELWVKDRQGNYTNVVVGFEDPKHYLEDTYYLGACIGRYAGRISGGFNLNDTFYPLENEDGVHLHSGSSCFGKKYWSFEDVGQEGDHAVRLKLKSPHMEGGYPGEIKASVTYKLEGSSIHIIHEATADKATVLNMTNHSYFRLHQAERIDEHRLQLNCSHFLETRENLLPTGRVLAVDETDMDFRKGKLIGPVRMDTPFISNPETSPLAELYSDRSGIRMRVSSNQPGVVVFTPLSFAGICFETQNFPDAPNFPDFPNSVLLPGQSYRNSAIFEFDLVI
ncbi:aldose epimerase family protein [Poritiphilus flavus]|uniref:Galactose mutarotase n=1 Tax=Poritiphilus flavus TaxID=2697053 RepID=A0A6L9E9I0_9FLAO|nr:aldose epimerase family protein [Poritiphilus flavus]NAS11303.1 galactose mutarotase [Poritiphilus flavus]